MDHPTIMQVYNVFMDPLIRIIIFAFLCLSIATNLAQWRERLTIEKRLGRKVVEWILNAN